MLNQETLNKIHSYGKMPGEYTLDEIYEIGVVNNSQPRGSKNWNELADILGCDKTGNALRCYVYGRMKREDTTPLKDLSGRKIKDEDTAIADMDERIADLYVQQTKTRDVYNAYRRSLREDARISSLKDAMIDAVKCVETLPQINYKPYKKVNEGTEAVLMISDLHIGVDCDNFYNKYNTEVAGQRLQKLVNDVVKYCKVNKVNTLHVLNLGDLIHGIIHNSARLEQQLDVVEQVMVAAELISRTLFALTANIPNVTYRSVVDNHSRAIASYKDHIEKENFNRLIDWYIEERLKDTSLTFIADNIDKGLGLFYLKNGKSIAFAHGHQDGINDVFQHFVGATGKFIDYALLGHYHSEKAKTYQNLKVIVNGSIVGTEQYALSKRLFSKPSQTLLVFDNDNLINLSINLA